MRVFSNSVSGFYQTDRAPIRYNFISKESPTYPALIYHPSWKVNTVLQSDINCDFKAMYGNDFGYLNTIKPHSVFIAEGSGVEVNWKREKI